MMFTPLEKVLMVLACLQGLVILWLVMVALRYAAGRPIQPTVYPRTGQKRTVGVAGGLELVAEGERPIMRSEDELVNEWKQRGYSEKRAKQIASEILAKRGQVGA